MSLGNRRGKKPRRTGNGISHKRQWGGRKSAVTDDAVTNDAVTDSTGGDGAGGGKANDQAPGGDDFKKALSYAYRLLGYRQRSQQELGARLRMKGFEPGTAQAVLERLLQSGYLDDRAMAHSLRLRAEDNKHLGLMGARHYLRRMGISQSNTEEALQEYDEDQGAAKLAEKKMRVLRDLPLRVARQRLTGYLKRRGFSAATVRKTIDAFIKEEE